MKMFNTIILKKKYIIFFFISLLISLILVVLINYQDNSNENEAKDNYCQKELLVDYNYNKILQSRKKNVTIIHSYLRSYFSTQLTDFFEEEIDNNEIFYEDNFIKFNKANCSKNYKKVLSEFEKIKEMTFIEYNNLKQYLKNNGIFVDLTDELIFMATNTRNIISIKEVQRKEQLKFPKFVIQFFIIILILNLGYFFISKIRIEIK